MILDFSMIWAQALLGLAIFWYFRNVPAYLAGIVLVGSAQHGLGLVAHEGAHHLIAPGRKRLNDFIGRWLFAAPHLLPYALYRGRHLLHHQHVSTEDDTKELYRRDIRGWRLTFELLCSLSGADYVRQVIAVLRRNRRDRGAAPAARSGLPEWMVKDLIAIAVVQLVMLGVLSAIDLWLYPLMWVVPNVTFMVLLSKIRSMVEHKPLAATHGAKPGSGFFMETATPCLRSVEAPWLERVFVSKINFHFHAEHHFWPFVSYQYLPTVHGRLVGSPQAKECGFVVERSYIAALKNFWAGR
jgi:fatty acid desaturase